jgi:hypothetical protein
MLSTGQIKTLAGRGVKQITEDSKCYCRFEVYPSAEIASVQNCTVPSQGISEIYLYRWSCPEERLCLAKETSKRKSES